MKRKLLSLALILSLVTSALMLMVVFTPTQCSAGFGDTPRATIFIENDDFFNEDNGVNGDGTGIAADPYIIENWAINASGTNGILIQNTTAYFIIRNCLVENGGGTYPGISLENAVNGKIENNTCDNNYYGIVLYLSSDNNVLNNNTCENNYFGIYVHSSSYDNLDNNTCENNYFGIYLYSSSDNNTLTNNNCSNNDGDGIHLLSSNYDNLINNTCSGNNGYGIVLSVSSYDNLTNNTCSGNDEDGIILLFADNNVLDNNTCGNNDYGISLRNQSDNNTLTNNICENNTIGIYQDSLSSNNTFTNNHLLNNTWACAPVPNNSPTCSITAPPDGYDTGVNEGIAFTCSYFDADGNSVTYSWDFGDGTTSPNQNQNHSYGSAGTYEVILTVSDGVETSTVTITINVTGGEAAPSPGGGPGPGGGGFVEQVAEEIEKVVQPQINPLFQIQIIGVPIFFFLLLVGAFTWTHKNRRGIHTMKGISYSIWMGVGFLLVMGAQLPLA